MKRNRLAILFSIAIFSTALTAISADAAGRSASSIPNTILNGKGSPTSSVGINGDFYIDTRSLLLFGPKTNGKWPAPQNLQGPTGAAGASGSDGKNGSDGKTVTNASTTAGPVGPAGPQGEKGATGATGPAGPTGAAGATGPQGATGPSGSGSGTPGPQGATGAAGATGATGATGPAGATGAAGTNGTNGSAGATGATGPQGDPGPAGATGATGPAGVSEVSVVSIANFTLSTNTPYGGQNSANFGSLAANSAYWFEIVISANSSVAGLEPGAELMSTGDTPSYSVIRTDFRRVTSTTSNKTYGFRITGTIATTASAVSLVIHLVDWMGDTASTPLVFSGKAYIAKVGTIN